LLSMDELVFDTPLDIAAGFEGGGGVSDNNGSKPTGTRLNSWGGFGQ